MAVPCTIESETRTSNKAPHLLSDNLAYVCQYPGHKDRHQIYMDQLQAYVKNCPADQYANAIYKYVSKGTLLNDINDILEKKWHLPAHKINIVFAVYEMPNDGRDDMWTDYYIKSLPKTGLCVVTGEMDYIPDAYPAKLLTSNGKERLLFKDSGVGYVASQKICHALQWLTYGQGNKQRVLLNELKGDGDRLIRTKNGVFIDFDIAVSVMDNDLRESVHYDLAPCNDQEFYDDYARRHIAKFGAGSWILDQIKPKNKDN